MLKIYFRKPLKGGKITSDMPESWSVASLECAPLAEGQEPPSETFITNMERALVDADGEPVKRETLRQYDLRGGLTKALTEAWA